MLRRTALIACLAALSPIAGCDTRTAPPIPRGDASIPGDASLDAATPRDVGPPVDSGPNLADVLIYAHSRDTLYTFSPFTNTVSEVGPFRTSDGAAAPFMLDLAVDSEGVVFTCSGDTLWRVNTETAVVTSAGDFDLADEQLFALSFLHPTLSPDGTEMLVGATNAGAYYSVSRTTAATDYLGQYPDGWSSSGDIVSIETLGNFATLRREDFDADVLARIDFTTGGTSVVTMLGPVRQGGTNFTQIFGLGYWGRDVFGFTNAGQLIRIDRSTGQAEVVSTSTGAEQFWGAGVTTVAPVLI